MTKSSVPQNKEEASQWSAGRTSQCFRDADEDEVQERAAALLAAERVGDVVIIKLTKMSVVKEKIN